MTGSRLAIVLLLLSAAWLVAPPARRAEAKPIEGPAPWARAVQTVLGPLRAPAAAALRLRAGFARQAGRAEESVQYQQCALEIDPQSTGAIVWFAAELATQIPLAGATSRDAYDCARAGIAALRRARALGNTDPQLLDWGSFLWVERAAPKQTSDPALRRAALDAAIAAIEEAPSLAAAWTRASALLEERGLLLYRAGDSGAAERDFARAAQYERLLAQRGDPRAESRAADLERRAAEAQSTPR